VSRGYVLFLEKGTRKMTTVINICGYVLGIVRSIQDVRIVVVWACSKKVLR
jgi:hypothetical protein